MRKFEPGNVCSTPGVNAKLEDSGFAQFMIVSLNRHINGDWGNMCDEDKAANEEALVDGLRLCYYDFAAKRILIFWRN